MEKTERARVLGMVSQTRSLLRGGDVRDEGGQAQKLGLCTQNYPRISIVSVEITGNYIEYDKLAKTRKFKNRPAKNRARLVFCFGSVPLGSLRL